MIAQIFSVFLLNHLSIVRDICAWPGGVSLRHCDLVRETDVCFLWYKTSLQVLSTDTSLPRRCAYSIEFTRGKRLIDYHLADGIPEVWHCLEIQILKYTWENMGLWRKIQHTLPQFRCPIKLIIITSFTHFRHQREDVPSAHRLTWGVAEPVSFLNLRKFADDDVILRGSLTSVRRIRNLSC